MLSSLTISTLIFLLAAGTLPGGTRSKEYQEATARPSVYDSKAQVRSAGSRSSASEVLGTFFEIPSQTCGNFNSSLDLTGADSVAISILGVNTDIRQTRVIPYFAVDGAPYFQASKVLEGDSFYSFMDAGGAVVPVMGSRMYVRLCNDETSAIRYTQLTVYVPNL